MSTRQTWAVRIHWTDTLAPHESTLEALSVALGPGSTVSVDERPEKPGDRARLSASIRVKAGTPRQAFIAGLRAFEAADDEAGMLWHDDIVGVEIRTRAEVERDAARARIPELVGQTEIAELLGVSKQRAQQLAQRADFPPPVQQLAGGAVRIKSAVERWSQTWERKAGRPKKVTEVPE